jgi:hypothetical protein
LQTLSGVILLLVGFSFIPAGAARAQGFVTAVPSRARVFPEIKSGVTAMKRDSAGRYYVLATPATTILIFSPEGKRIGEIPRADSETAKIQYAVDFDIDATGRILVADRAANAIEIFSPEGSLLAKILVFAPTGVVALPDRQFAVSTLRSKRLVEIRNEQGVLIRSFGDPADAGIDADSKKLQNIGKISGDGAGYIYFAFTALPDPTVRKYDRYGYAASEATFAASQYEPGLNPSPDDRVQFGVNFREVSFSDSYNTWATIGNKGDILFGGGLSPGLGAHIGSGPATAQSATDNILSTTLAAGPGGGGAGGMAGGGMVSAQGSYQAGDALHVRLGAKPRPGASGNGKGSSDGSKTGQGSSDGTVLQFSGQDSSSPDTSGSDALFSFAQPPPSDSAFGTAAPGGGPAGIRGGGGFGGGGIFGGEGVSPGIAGFGRFGGSELGGGIGGGFFNQNFSQTAPGLSEIGPANLRASPSSGGGSFGDRRFGGYHGGYGRDLYNLTGTVKVNLDHFASGPDDKPVITAVGVDPVTQEIWAAIGRVLAHFDKGGAYLADYYIVTPEGTPLRVSAIVVEPNRLLVASDSRGIFEFARPDARSSRSSMQGAVIPPRTTPQNPNQQTPQQ